MQVFALADRHDVVPLLHRELQKLPPGMVPFEAQKSVARRAHACVAWNLHLRGVLLHLLALFNDADLPVLPLKGLGLSQLLYGDCTLRPTNDLDLLVREVDVERAVQLLLSAGCRRHFAPEQEVGLYHLLFTFKDGNDTEALIELHRDLTSEHLTRLDVTKVWAAASPSMWEGRVAWTMRTEDLFLYLCTHAMRDGLGSIKHLLDIAFMIERFGSTWNWETLNKTVAEAHIEAPVWLTLWHCQRFFPAALPPGFLDAIRPRRGVGFVLGQALFSWRGGVLSSPPALLRSPMGTILDFLWEDSLRGKLRHLRRMLLPYPGLRARKTGLVVTTSAVHGSPRWLWQGSVQLLGQIRMLVRLRYEQQSSAP
jgi:hypothetical protein